ncbi:MAG: hypothetical protein WDM70_07790 [Nitrosomonadales bacterium]
MLFATCLNLGTWAHVSTLIGCLIGDQESGIGNQRLCRVKRDMLLLIPDVWLLIPEKGL